MMTNIYDTLVAALCAHWATHENRYPQKFVLPSSQHQALLELREVGGVALGESDAPPANRFMGVALEIDDASPGEIVNHDGTRAQLLAP